KLTAVKAGTEGNAISVEVLAPTAASSELAVTVTNNKISIQLASDESGALTTTAAELASALMADPAAKALVTAVALGDGSGDVAPVSRAYLSGGENEPFPLKKPVAVAGSRKLIEKLGKEGTLPAAFDDIFDQTGALVIVVRAEKGQTEEQTQANVIEAMQAFLDSQTETGYTPRILVAPEFSQFDAVASELEAKAKRLRAIAYLDCNRIASYTDAIKRARQFGERVEITWPWVRVFDT
ncbi:phage tail protein, partial [Vibrio cholerae]|nr:phage tail protein [Vibrio cholerae]